MKIKKRSGKLENLDITAIQKQTIEAHEGLGLDREVLEMEANIQFSDGMRSQDIQQILINTAMKKVDVDVPNYTFVAGRLMLNDLYHKIHRLYKNSKQQERDIYKEITFQDYFDYNKEILSWDDNLFDMKSLQRAINSKNDLLLTGLAVETLIARYLARNNNNVAELPQHMLMSIACFLASTETGNHTKHALNFYDIMTTLEYLPATPTLSNGRLKDRSCFSCFVGTTEDSLTDIFRSYADQAQISKLGGGIGWDWTRVRALGGEIQGVKGAAGGLVPWLKIENDLSIAVDQLGVRQGAISVYVESWHLDIIDFLDLKKNSGEDKRRAKELFLSVSCSDTFMERVESEKDWILFDPADTPELAELFGQDFKNRYEQLEKKFINQPLSFNNEPKVINAKTLWKKIQKMYFETGMPFLYFKDTVNIDHMNKDLGIIRSSNLCTEFLNPVKDKTETAVCNLGSINLSKFSPDNLDRLAYVVKIATRMLDNVIDISSYPTKISEDTQKYRRSIGLGVAGEGEALANQKILHGTPEHREWISIIYGTMARASDKASMELAIEKGPWREGEEFRNAYRRCIAPTSSVSIIMGTTPSHEAVYDKVWIEENKMGNYRVTAPGISHENFEYYKSAYEYNQADLARATGWKQEFIDMGISHNFYFDPSSTSGKEVFESVIAAWKAGLKTTYYMRTDSPKASNEEVSTRVEKIACVGCAG